MWILRGGFGDKVRGFGQEGFLRGRVGRRSRGQTGGRRRQEGAVPFQDVELFAGSRALRSLRVNCSLSSTWLSQAATSTSPFRFCCSEISFCFTWSTVTLVAAHAGADAANNKRIHPKRFIPHSLSCEELP